jgi:hypothetical protein
MRFRYHAAPVSSVSRRVRCQAMAHQEPKPEELESAFKRAVAALRKADIPFLLGGSLAAWARGGPQTRHDLDLMVKPEDAEAALEAFAEAGMRTDKPAEEWLYKAWDGDVLIDLIFEPSGLLVDDDLLARGEDLSVLSVTVCVMTLEDVLVTKLMSLDEHSLDYTGLLQIARPLREQVDWGEVRERTQDSPYAAPFFTLLEVLDLAQVGRRS